MPTYLLILEIQIKIELFGVEVLSFLKSDTFETIMKDLTLEITHKENFVKVILKEEFFSEIHA